MKTSTVVLLAVAPVAAAAALITAPASSAMTCVAAAVPASAATLKFTSSTLLANMTARRGAASDRLAVAGPSGYSRAHPATTVVVTAPRSCV